MSALKNCRASRLGRMKSNSKNVITKDLIRVLLPWLDSNLRPSGAYVQQPYVTLYQLSYTANHIYLSEVRLMQVPNPA